MPKDFNYEKLQPIDVVCTSASSLAGRLIRLYTARLKGKNGALEFTRQRIANHCAIVVQMDSRLWLAEMVDDGLKINSMRDYLNNKKEKIVAIKRNYVFSNEILRTAANKAVLDLCQETRKYDYRMVLQYLGVGQNSGSKYYCSELCEVIANMFKTTWDNWQLKNMLSKKCLIAPVEIQFGDPARSKTITDFYV